MILLDMSRSHYFGTAKKLKHQLAAELSAVLAFAAIKNNDKVGLIGFTDEIEIFVPPRKGLRHILRIVREALYFSPRGRGTNIPQAIEYLNRVTTRKTVTFIISDFYASDFKAPLSISNKRHDIVAITVTDPRELELPDVGFIELEDAETGEILTVDTSYEDLRGSFSEKTSQAVMDRTKLFQSMNVDHIDIRTDHSYIEPLIRFFRMRAKRFR